MITWLFSILLTLLYRITAGRIKEEVSPDVISHSYSQKAVTVMISINNFSCQWDSTFALVLFIKCFLPEKNVIVPETKHFVSM
jgi:hypothetical protein